ncbi:MAG: 5'-nucleotidase C-terminal domain-containing protein [bacterium]
MIKGRAAVGLCLLGLIGCEAEPAQVPDDAGRVDASRPREAGVDRGSQDAAVDADGLADAGDLGPTPDMGVACGDFLPGDPVARVVLLHAGGSASALLSPDDTGGAARFVTRMRRLQADALDAEEAAVATVGSGDSFLAGATFAVSLERGVPFLGGLALASAGFDALGLGNHDFDFGPAILADFVRSTARQAEPSPDGADAGVSDAGLPAVPDPPPFLITNLDVSAEVSLQALVDDRRLVRQHVVRSNGRRIGIVGATTDHLADESSPGQVEVRPAVAAVQAEIDSLTEAGVGIIVLVAHLDSPQAELELVQRLRGVDILVSGAADELRASGQARLVEGDTPVAPYVSDTCDADGRRVRVVAVPGGYRYIGRLIVDFDAEGHIARVDPAAIRSGSWVARPATRCRRIPGCWRTWRPPARGARDPGRQRGRRDRGRPRRPPRPAPGGRDQPGRPGGRLAAVGGGGAGLRHGRRAGRRGDHEWRGHPHQPGGPGRRRHGAGHLLHAPLRQLRRPPAAVSRDELKAVLENAFSQAEDGAGRFPQVAGMQIEWLPDGPARQLAPNGTVLQPGARVRRVVLDSGTVIVEDGVVRPGPPLVVATIDFLARGGDQYPFTGAFEAFGVSYQQALRDFIAGALEGRIDAADYPEGASDRIRRLR